MSMQNGKPLVLLNFYGAGSDGHGNGGTLVNGNGGTHYRLNSGNHYTFIPIVCINLYI